MDTDANRPDRRDLPWDAHLFGWGPVAPFPVALLGMWLGPPWLGELALRLAVIWGACIILFVSGVRRGYGFALPDGPRPHVLVLATTMFAVAFLSLVLVPPVGALLLAGCFAALTVLDPLAAKRGEAPLWFARLRPVQMAIPAICLVGLAFL